MSEIKRVSATANYFLKENIENPTLSDVTDYVIKTYPNYSEGQIIAVSKHILSEIS